MFDSLGMKVKAVALVQLVLTAIFSLLIFFLMTYKNQPFVGLVYGFFIILVAIGTCWLQYCIGEIYDHVVDASASLHSLKNSITQPPAATDSDQTKSPKERENCKYTFAAQNWYPGQMIQPGVVNFTYDETKTEISVAFASSSTNGITGVNCKLEAETVFDEKLVFDDLRFTALTKEDRTILTGKRKIGINPDDLSSIRTIRLHIKNFISDGVNHVPDVASEDSLLDANSLLKLKKEFGYFAIRLPETGDDRWSCVCGHDSEATASACPVCGAHRSSSKNFAVDPWEELMRKIKETSYAKEIYPIAVEWDKGIGDGRLQTSLHSLKELCEVERMYGNQKSEAEKILRAARDAKGNE